MSIWQIIITIRIIISSGTENMDVELFGPFFASSNSETHGMCISCWTCLTQGLPSPHQTQTYVDDLPCQFVIRFDLFSKLEQRPNVMWLTTTRIFVQNSNFLFLLLSFCVSTTIIKYFLVNSFFQDQSLFFCFEHL